ncbi:MAG: hypothetical protein K9J17_00335 [Flavobacteriales bacterium]|nr:hypothetical protein [Flavobacteriales bacterium]
MKVLKAISSFILSLLILLSSMGFYVDHMVCGMSGEHKLAINQTIDSCSDSCERADEDAVKRTCCDYESFYFKEDVPATATETSSKTFASAFRFVPLHQVFADLNCAENFCFRLFEETDILPSIERHILLETYLI